jgi:hypothetical protein
MTSLKEALIVALVTILLAQATSQSSTAAESVSLDTASLTVLGVRAGGAETLAHVVSRFGPAKIWSTGDASESTSQMCYRVSAVEPSPLIWFGSNNAMSDPKGQVNHIVVYADSREFRDRRLCGVLTRPVEAIRTPSGLKLGMTAGDARRILTTAHFHQGRVEYRAVQRKYLDPSDHRYAHWSSQKECFPDVSRPYFDDFGHILIEFKAGRASRIRLNRNQAWC